MFSFHLIIVAALLLATSLQGRGIPSKRQQNVDLNEVCNSGTVTSATCVGPNLHVVCGANEVHGFTCPCE